MKANKYDKVYNKLKPSTNIWGTAVGTDWTGKQAADERAKKNGLSRDMQMWRDAGALSLEEAKKRGKSPRIAISKQGDSEKKKFFGLF